LEPNQWSGNWTTTGNEVISFKVVPTTPTSDSGGIISIDGNPLPSIDARLFATGPIASTGDGFIVIVSPTTGKTLTLDFRQWDSPKRSTNY
jgi:hypothetical protein